MTNPSKQIRAVIFDWAGTMIDFGSCAPASIFRKVFDQHGVPISSEQARRPMGMAKRDHISAIMHCDDVPDRWKEKFGHEPTEQDIDRLYEKFLPLQKSVIADHCDMIPGAVEAFQWCREQEIRVGSSTGYTRELMEVVSPIAAAAGYCPEAILCAEDAPQGRPAPWMILEIAKQLNVFPMNQVVKVDDTIVGIEAGKNAGCWTVGVALSGNLMGLSQDELEALPSDERGAKLDRARNQLISGGADFVIDSVADIPETIEQINQQLNRDSSPIVGSVSIHESIANSA